MLNELEYIQFINQNTCPVRICVTDGLEDTWARLPILKPFVRCLDTAPQWARANFAWWVLIDAKGEHLFAGLPRLWFENRANGFPGVPIEAWRSELKDGYSLHEKWRLLNESGDSEDLKDIQRTLTDYKEQSLFFLEDVRAMSAEWLCTYRLGASRELFPFLMHHPDPDDDLVAPGVRNAMIHGVGQILTDQRPLDPLVDNYLSRIFSHFSQHPDSNWQKDLESKNGDHPFPYPIRQIAANTLSQLAGVAWEEGTDDEVKAATRWYAEHQNNPEYEVNYSSDPRLRYVLLEGAASE